MSSSEALNGLSEFHGDGLSVHDDVVLNDSDVLNWVLKCSNNLIKLSPVHLFGVNGFTNWDGLFKLLDEGEGSNGTSNSFSDILVLVGIFEGFNGHLEDLSGFISFIDADKEVLEIEGSNLSG